MVKRFALVILLVISFSNLYGFDREGIHRARMGDSDQPVITNYSEKISLNNYSLAGTDITISSSVSPSTFNQDNSSVASLKSGGHILVFNDNRFGSEKILGQFYDSESIPIGSNFLIAGSTNGADYMEPIVKTDTLERIYIFYHDRSNGLIFGSRYNSDMTVDVADFLINETSLNSYSGPFDFDVYPDGKIVVVWENYSVLGSNINMRLYDTSLSSTFGPSTVNSDGGSSSHWVPSVTVDPIGDILVAWEDYRNSRADIYIRLFNGAGTAIGSDLAIVPPPFNALAQFAPRTAFSTADKFVIGWIDQRDSQQIFLQKFKASSGLIGSNFEVSDGNPAIINWNLTFSINTDDNLVAHWASFGPENNIMRADFDAGFVLSAAPTPVNLSNTGQRWTPAADVNSDNELVLCWTEFENDHTDIHLNIFDGSGTALFDPEIKVNDDQVGAVSSNPVVVPLGDWYNWFLFEDSRNDAGDIFCVTVSNSGINYNSNTRVNQDVGRNLQSSPSAAAAKSINKALAVWVDSRDIGGVPGQRIFARAADELGRFSSDEFIVSDSFETAVKSSTSVVMNEAGQTLVTWLDRRNGSAQVYGRWLDAGNNFIGNEFLISNNTADSSLVYQTSGIDSSNRYYVIWLDKGLTDPASKIRWFNNDRSDGGSFNWSSTVIGVKINELSASVSQSGEVHLLWSGLAGDREIYLTVLDNSGSITVPSMLVTDDVNANASDPVITVGEHDHITCAWVDRRGGKQIVYYSILDDLYQPLGVNLPVSGESVEYMINPNLSAHHGRAWFVWADPRADGQNIIANNFVYLPTDVEDEISDVLPQSYTLSQNYPNPFNPSTTISFRLPEKSDVILSIYNILGQSVKTIARGEFIAGEHIVEWDGRDSNGNPVAGGLYLYKLETEQFSQSKKMILLK